MDGWPIFNDGKNITFETSGRDEITQLVAQARPEGIRWQAALDSKSNALELGWYQRNTPLKPFHSFTDRPGYLRLRGSCYNLASPESPALLLRKQEGYHDIFSVSLEFRPSRRGYEAGITVWWNLFSYASIGITAVSHEDSLVPTVVCRKPTGKNGKLMTTYPAFDDSQTFDVSVPCQLSAQANLTDYTLTLSQGSSIWKFVFNAEELCILPPIGGAFTGTMFGIYSFGTLEPVLDPADFKDIILRE